MRMKRNEPDDISTLTGEQVVDRSFIRLGDGILIIIVVFLIVFGISSFFFKGVTWDSLFTLNCTPELYNYSYNCNQLASAIVLEIHLDDYEYRNICRYENGTVESNKSIYSFWGKNPKQIVARKEFRTECFELIR